MYCVAIAYKQYFSEIAQLSSYNSSSGFLLISCNMQCFVNITVYTSVSYIGFLITTILDY